MWILLMIVFSQPYQVFNIEIIGTYGSKKSCTQEVKRALTIGVPIKSSFGCILVKKLNHLQNVSHGTKGGNMKWVLASSCIKCEEEGDTVHTAICMREDKDGSPTPLTFNSQTEAELYITEEIKENYE